MDRHSKEQRSKNMKAVKSSGSEIEKILAKKLWEKGFRYRKQAKEVFGKPDFIFKTKKIAIFCDSEFWHGKNWETKKHEIQSNQNFWHSKIEQNILRDKLVNQTLAEQGWIVIRFWGKDIFRQSNQCIHQIEIAFHLRNQKI
jgi:DNA mismatch endonuclease Vsr